VCEPIYIDVKNINPMLTWHANVVRHVEWRTKLGCMKNVEGWNGYFVSLGMKLSLG
jgi:hypothetical protein